MVHPYEIISGRRQSAGIIMCRGLVHLYSGAGLNAQWAVRTACMHIWYVYVYISTNRRIRICAAFACSSSRRRVTGNEHFLQLSCGRTRYLILAIRVATYSSYMSSHPIPSHPCVYMRTPMRECRRRWQNAYQVVIYYMYEWASLIARTEYPKSGILIL